MQISGQNAKQKQGGLEGVNRKEFEMLTNRLDKPNEVGFQELLVPVTCKQFFECSSVCYVGPWQCVCLSVMPCGKYIHKADDESSRDH